MTIRARNEMSTDSDILQLSVLSKEKTLTILK